MFKFKVSTYPQWRNTHPGGPGCPGGLRPQGGLGAQKGP